MIHVCSHAIDRYIERVAPVSHSEARALLSSPFIQRAIEFGAKYVKLAKGQRVVIENGRIVTVLPKEHPAGLMNMARDQKFRESNQEGIGG
jgi:hypothetical protein